MKQQTMFAAGLGLFAGAVMTSAVWVALRSSDDISNDQSNALLEEWQAAVLNGDFATMKRFPTSEVGVDSPIDVRRSYRELRLDGPATALIVTAAAGNVEAVEYLLHMHADVNAADAKGNTPLHAAVASGEPNVVSLLIQHGADLNAAAGKEERTPLVMATLFGEESIAIQLIAAGADVNRGTERGLTSLMYAAMDGRPELCRQLLHRGAEISATERRFGWTAHIYAARHGQVEVMPVLENAGADQRQKDNRGEDSLYHAALNSHIALDSLKYLLSKGADPNTTANNGSTPLHAAARVGSAEAVILLHEAGGNLEAPNSRGKTPLDVLRERDDEEARRALSLLGCEATEHR